MNSSDVLRPYSPPVLPPELKGIPGIPLRLQAVCAEVRRAGTETLQKLFAEFEAIPASDAGSTDARKIMDFIKTQKAWIDPVKIECTAAQDFCIGALRPKNPESGIMDGAKTRTLIKTGQKVQFYPWEVLAYVRFLEPVQGIEKLLRKGPNHLSESQEPGVQLQRAAEKVAQARQ